MKTKTKTKTNSLLASLACVTLATGTASAAMIMGTGWTTDVVVDSGAASVAEATNGGFFHKDGDERLTIPQSGFTALGTIENPLVISGSNVVTTVNGTDFFVDPTANNAFTDSGGTLTLNTASAYQDLQFLVFGIGNNSGGNNFQATLTFDTGSPTVLAFHVQNWDNPTSYDAFATESAYIVDGLTILDEQYARELTFDLAPADEARNIVSIEIAATSARMGVVGISGTTVPEPSSTALLGIGGIALILRRRK
jgi:hypothetical protein